jgi:hemerythrin-like metal-binding protein
MNPEIFSHYRIEIPEIDDAHWDVITRLNAAIKVAESDRKFANGMVKEAIKILQADLKEEERLMYSYSYPYLNAHKVAHDELVDKLQESLNQMEAGFRYMSPSYIIGRWQRSFLDHIDQHDMQLATFIQRQ